MTNAELAALLSHPDAYVRSLADHALRNRKPVAMPDNGIPSYRIEDCLSLRLAALARHNLTASDQYYLEEIIS